MGKTNLLGWFFARRILLLGSVLRSGTLAGRRTPWFPDASVRVSLVIPAFCEERRLPSFLAELATWNRQHGPLEEVIVVDDGSTDRTAAVAESFRDRLPLRVIRFPENRGKGAAVQAGVQASAGDVIIFVDADGATGPAEIPNMITALGRAPVAVGNRWLPGAEVREREAFRAFSGWVYRTYVGFFGLGGIDTMCGFKGFRREVARELFSKLLHERWLFDTEIMLHARRRGIRIENFPIAWTSKHGSKLRPAVLVKALFEIPVLAWKVRHERSLHSRNE